ncbi:MAG: alpha-1,4-glucan--maltose-1-phosphate maltosyltransferase [Polyangiaceae bacterium]|nr:alpha-1,4-glucan--maltose-1-phosphate maltosyltransferase [Polyangiaceae bacterium]
MARHFPQDGKRRVVIEAASPAVDGGHYPAKRVLLDVVDCSCDLVSDGHDSLGGRMLYRRVGERTWQSSPLVARGNDRWSSSFVASEIGRWEITFEAWIDAFATWRLRTEKKRALGENIDVELLIGAHLLSQAASRVQGELSALLNQAADRAADRSRSEESRFEAATSEQVVRAMERAPDLSSATRYDHILSIVVDPPLARFGSWYELFPRSFGTGGNHGTLSDVVRRLDYVAQMGFDVLYLPPIHPIGRAFRKGPNNMLTAGPNDPGSPWAIGSEEGGHKAIHPALGTFDDFRRLVREVRARKMEIALDIAFQVSPDHPYVHEHPNWFFQRPDGKIQFAENPPKKYQDIYPFNFECDDWQSLWAELLDVFLFWVGEGVRVFRIDNPHTKSLRFWEWCIGEIKAAHPEVIFLAEAFTRPKVMHALAKSGFSQSYTYFTWRSTKVELEAYLREITEPHIANYFRPNFWPNTPDILPEHLQYGGRPTFLLRLVLAATLSSSYGIYGPAFELMEHVAKESSEEYKDSEKYQLRSWDLESSDSLFDAIARINAIRRDNPALQQTEAITFHPTTSDSLFCFSKRAGDNVVLIVANMDTHHEHSGILDLDLPALGLKDNETFQVHDLISDVRYTFCGSRNHVSVDPRVFPVQIFVVRKKIRSEHDFEYYQ